MLSGQTLLLFTIASFVLALTPGPVWLYLVSRTLAQGRRAGYFSMLGVTAGLAVHALFAALGLSVVLLAIPLAFDVIRLAGAAYLLWLAWTTIRGEGLGFEARPLPPAADGALLRQAFVAAFLNPKVAIFYLSLFPQFVDPAAGSVLAQSLLLGAVQLATAAVVDISVVTAAGLVAVWFARRPGWLSAQRWVLGGAFGALAAWLALDRKTA
jgi:threonine/homoserine/homoserine lactone efflux protein